jgi:hypothetical protein
MDKTKDLSAFEWGMVEMVVVVGTRKKLSPPYKVHATRLF